MNKRLWLTGLSVAAAFISIHQVWALGCPDLQNQMRVHAAQSFFKESFHSLNSDIQSLTATSSYNVQDLNSALKQTYQAIKSENPQSENWQKAESYLSSTVIQEWQTKYPDGWTPDMWNMIRHKADKIEGFFPALEDLRPNLQDSLWNQTVVQITNTWANHIYGYLEMIKLDINVDLNRTRLSETTRKLLLFRSMAERHIGKPLPDNLTFLD